MVQLRKSIGAPGMAVLQFGNIAKAALSAYFSYQLNVLCSNSIYLCGTAFGGGSDNPHLLHNHEMDQVVYTGTHDNDTVSSKFLFDCLLF